MSVLAPVGHECPPAPSPVLRVSFWPRPDDLLQAALNYRHFGWSVIPMRGKQPAIRWKPWQWRRMRDDQLGAVFRDYKRPLVTGVAVVLGGVSGWLTCRDFDTHEAYAEWAARHPDVAAACPTVRTCRGVHVYYRDRDKVEWFTRWPDGELRGRRSHYVMLPPSRHPGGGTYEWLTPEPPGPSAFPLLCVLDTGFVDPDHPLSGRGSRTPRKTRELRESLPMSNRPAPIDSKTSSVKGRCSNEHRPANAGALRSPRTVEEAITRSLPGGPGERHWCIFNFCRALRSMACFEGKGAEELVPEFRQWFDRAYPMIRTKDWATSLDDFLDGFDRVNYPAGVGLGDARLVVAQGPLPREAAGYTDEPTRKLLALCVGLASEAKGGVFYLSARTAHVECGFGNHATANARLKRLAQAGLLEVVKAGTPGRTARVATRFRLGGAALPPALSSAENRPVPHSTSAISWNGSASATGQ